MRAGAVLGLVLALSGCGPAEPTYALDLPTGFPQIAVPADNPLTPEKVELGRHLFYDTTLSGNGQQSCASCHHQDKAFTDGRVVAEGSTGMLHPRNSSTLTNNAYNATLAWANPRLTTLEQQILIPLFGEAPIELGADEAVLDRIASEALYQDLYLDAFPERDGAVDWDTTVQALASFSRVLVSGDSPFDRFSYQGDTSAMSESARRGLVLFFSETLECHHCHGGFNFSESTVHAGTAFDAALFHNTGLYNLDGQGAYPTNNTGVFELTGDPQDMGRFRPPTLRNAGVTAPYMHDGSMQTLDEVIRHYERGGRRIESGPLAGDGAESPLKSGLVAGFSLTDAERDDLIAFLMSLTDERFLTNPALADPFGAP